jgi:hypothetical protein
MSKTLKTPKGTDLPLVNLKGKQYLLVAHRLQWFNEEVSNFQIETKFLHIDDDQTVAQSTVTIFNEQGQMIKSVSATKRETKKDFSDHTEKAETGSIGRCMALIGYGTQFALADLDEGSRIVDSPVTDVKESSTETKQETPKASSSKSSGFSRPNKATETKQTEPQQDDGWQ